MTVPRRFGLGWLAALVVTVVPLGAEATRGADRLAELLGGSGSYRVRAQAALSLGRLGEPGSVSALVDALEDAHPAVRAAAASALGRIGSPSALPPLATVASNVGEAPEVRVGARRAIEQIRDRARGSTLQAQACLSVP